MLDGSEEGCRANLAPPEAASGRLLEKADVAGWLVAANALDEPGAWREKGVVAGEEVVTCRHLA